jgi:PAS domain S-box-containing protein
VKKILVVDNNPLMLEFMKELLGEQGYEVRTAVNGLEALHAVEEEIPDVVFVDLVMPQIDGKQLTKLLRANEKLDDSYIVVVSGVAAECGKEQVPTEADAHIAKSPFKRMREHILAVLENIDKKEMGSYESRVVGCDELFQREITGELLYSKHHLESLIAHLADGFIEMTRSGEVIYNNPAACRLLNTGEAELITSYFPGFFSREDSERIEGIIGELDSEAVEDGEEQPYRLNGRKILLRFIPIHYEGYSSVSVILQDITERKRGEEVIRNSLEHKEYLLKEVHHRVKNNLSVVASLLNLQSSQVEDEEVRKHLVDSKNRVESMALVHERLYNSEDYTGIDLRSYLEGITHRLIEVYQNSEDRLSYFVTVPSITVPMELAVPLGLIVNETVSNSLEHAFFDREGKRNGSITIEFETGDEDFALHISDDGAGLPEGYSFDIDTTQTLGLLLADTLAQQIHGSFRIADAQRAGPSGSDASGEGGTAGASGAGAQGRRGVRTTVRFPKKRWSDKLIFREQ